MRAISSKEKEILKLIGIEKSFPGVKALDKVNLTVYPGRVHVICGENGAGKSTLMKVINGMYVPDSGEMYFKGKKIGKHSILKTMHMGIAMIYQELNPVMEMTIADNIFLGREPKKGLLMDDKKLNQDTQELLDLLNIPYKAQQKMKELSIAAHQLVEIAKAISLNAAVIIMDEPSSAISDKEVTILFQQIERLKKQGVAIIYITHKMDEIFQIADDITVIRDGKWIDSAPATEYNQDKLVAQMVGREILDIFPKDDTIPIGEVVLEVKNLTQKEANGGRFKNISFSVKAGEILGFSGLVGAGRSELMQAVFGMNTFDQGEIFIKGKKVKISNTADAISYGIAMAPEDRREHGLVLERSVRENISLVNLKNLCKGLLLSKSLENKTIEKMVALLQIKVPNAEVMVSTLSGGNQQKVVLSKWLSGDLSVIILDEPTRGIDVGTKAEIHKLIGEFARQGVAIIMISSELPEIMGMSDRVVVMQEGQIQGEIMRSDLTQEKIMYLATKGFAS